MDATSFVIILGFTALSTLVSLICQIYVSRKLKKAEIAVGPSLGRLSWIKPFVQGWKYAQEMEIVDVMIFWSVILGLSYIGVFLTAFSFIAVSKTL